MLHLTPFLTVYSTILAFILGTVMASFLGCMGWRMCKGESVLRGRSHCDTCGHTLGARDLIPILSFLMSKGRCRYCDAKISKMNLIGEIGMGALFAVLVLFDGNLYFVFLHLCFFSILYLVTITDIIDQIIPDSALLVAIVVRVVAFVLNYKYDFYGGEHGSEVHALWMELLGLFVDGIAVSLPLLILVLIMEKLLKKDAMGGGDIKLLFVTGLYLGWERNILVIFFACIIGIITASIQQKMAGESASEEDDLEDGHAFYFAFGPSIAVSAVLMLFFGNLILDWYLSLF